MIPVYTPWVARNQKAYVNEALDGNKLTFHGRFVAAFERAVADYVGARHCVAVANGSVALYAMYDCAGLRGKRVLTNGLTYAATVSQLLLLGCEVVVLDCDDRFQMDPDRLRDALNRRPVDAVVVAPLYADAPDMGRVRRLCHWAGVPLLEDAAEGFACSTGGRALGTFGAAGTYSFFANKVVTCGEGGAVVTDDDALAARLRAYVNQGVTARFHHETVGTNFRMTNLQAAVGAAQMEEVETIVGLKRRLATLYRRKLRPEFRPVVPAVGRSSEWMPVFELPAGADYPAFERWMTGRGVEVRPVFKPVPDMPAFGGVSAPFGLDRARAAQGRYAILPASPGLTDHEIQRVVGAANQFVLDSQ